MLFHLAGQNINFTTDVPVVSYDILPTLAELCNLSLDYNYDIDGTSLKPLLTLKGQDELYSRDLYWHKASQRPTSTGDYVSTALRCGNYKLIDFYLQDRIELYNLALDPNESTNIASLNKEIAQSMLNKIDLWRSKLNVKIASEKNHNKTK